MTELPGVSVVVLNHNGKHHLGPCLESIQAMDYPADRIELIVCDNASTDGSAAYVKDTFPNVRLIELDQNYGFAEGNNRAAREARQEWVAFLNNDMRVDERWLAELVAAAQERPGTVCTSAKILNWNGSSIDFIGAGVNFQGFGWQWDFGRASSPRDTARRILCPCGGAMLIRRDVFLELGGFDPDYFGFFEDTDLGWRLNLIGHDVWYAPKAVALHRQHGTYDRFSSHKVRLLYERNSMCTIYKCLDDANLALALPAAMLLLNEKALRLGTIEIKDYLLESRDQGGGTPPPARALRLHAFDPGAAPRGSLLTRARRVLREQGSTTLAHRTARYLKHSVQHRVYRLIMGIAHGVSPSIVPVPTVAVAHWVALSDFGHSLDKLREKRRWLQERRQRSDDELLELFYFALQPSFDEAEYVKFHRWLCQVTGIEERFRAGQMMTLKEAGI